jgi:hypothetical protein
MRARSSRTALPMKIRMHSACVSAQPLSLSTSRNTPLVMGSLSTSTPSQSKSTASNVMDPIGP